VTISDIDRNEDDRAPTETKMTEHPTLTEALQHFAPRARDVLAGLAARGGVLEPPDARAVGDFQGLALPELMVSLLPVAAAFARPRISDYRVGAVASTAPIEDGWGRIYLGGNVEFRGEALGLTIHAEQAVTLNARFGGESAISAVAVSSRPCGHCRQFLSEIAVPPDVFTVSRDGTGVARHSMEQLLPFAFGPVHLGVEAGLLDQRRTTIVLESDDQDSPVVQQALRAARSSYAPYTDSYAGCALRTEQGTVHAGGYVEIAAFNPSVLAVQSALLHLHLRGPGLDVAEISDVALVEVDGPTTQLAATQRLLDVVAPEATFSYHRGRVT
jgi:cytidine deaminase